MNLEKPLCSLDTIIYPKDFLKRFNRLDVEFPATAEQKEHAAMEFFFGQHYVHCSIVYAKTETELDNVYELFRAMYAHMFALNGTMIIDAEELAHHLARIRKEIDDGIPLRSYIPSLLWYASCCNCHSKEDHACSFCCISKLNNGYFKLHQFFSTSESFLNPAIQLELVQIADKMELDKFSTPKNKNSNKRHPIDSKLRHEVFKRDDYTCVECGKSKTEITLHADHVLPVSQGGTDELSNLQTLCRDCNLTKSDKCFVGGTPKPKKTVFD